MDKQHILEAIRSTSKDGKAIGQKMFLTETGIKPHEWLGKYWTKWGDALIEAGYSENEWQAAYDESYILESILRLTQELGKYPTKAEMQIERRRNVNFPSPHPLRRIGSKAELIRKLIDYGQLKEGFEEVVQVLRETPVSENHKEPENQDSSRTQLGYVYLIHSAHKYKIGFSKAALNRASVVSNLSPEGGEIIHLIRTDDMRGIEAYWHNRFAEKRGNGEWFALSSTDVAAFMRRKFM